MSLSLAERSARTKTHLSEIDARNENNAVTLLASIRYKPEDESEHHTDHYGYSQTELQPIMTLQNLSEEEVARIEKKINTEVEQRRIFATKSSSLSSQIRKFIKRG